MIGTTPTALARRGIGLDRLAVLTLRQDAYAAAPGPTLPLYLGERTQYRPAAWLLDTFDRPDGAPGAGYTPWLTAAPAIVGRVLVPGVGGAPQVARHALSLPRDQWATCRLVALGGAGTGGVGLRLSGSGATAAGYRAVATGGTALVHRYRAGALETVLVNVPVPWQAGDVLTCRVEWNRIRLERNGVLVAAVTDPDPILTAGQAGVGGTRASGGDVARLNEFAAGPQRQEYVGALADLGDVSASLGLVEPTASPAAWDATVVNVAPLGGAARFSGLLRHGTQAGSDLHRAPITVAHAIRDGSVPLAVADGRVARFEALTEATVRLHCAGRDAFLTPDIQAGLVAYLPGENPILVVAPLPADPCGADAVPTIVPGGAAAEPPPAGDLAGIGPEAPSRRDAADGAADGGLTALRGGYVVHLFVIRGDTSLTPPEPEWVTRTDVYALPGRLGDDPDAIPPDTGMACPGLATPGDFIGGEGAGVSGPTVGPYAAAGLGHAYFPAAGVGEISRWMVLHYRGPDVAGAGLQMPTAPLWACVVETGLAGPTAPTTILGLGTVSPDGGELPVGVTVSATGKLARYAGAGIRTVADLQALRLATPADGGEYQHWLPTRIETLATWTGVKGPGVIASDAFRGWQDLGGDIGVTLPTGPSLVGVELIEYVGTSSPRETYSVHVILAAGGTPPVFVGLSPCIRGL